MKSLRRGRVSCFLCYIWSKREDNDLLFCSFIIPKSVQLVLLYSKAFVIFKQTFSIFRIRVHVEPESDVWLRHIFWHLNILHWLCDWRWVERFALCYLVSPFIWPNPYHMKSSIESLFSFSPDYVRIIYL